MSLKMTCDCSLVDMLSIKTASTDGLSKVEITALFVEHWGPRQVLMPPHLHRHNPRTHKNKKVRFFVGHASCRIDVLPIASITYAFQLQLIISIFSRTFESFPIPYANTFPSVPAPSPRLAFHPTYLCYSYAFHYLRN